MVIRLIQRGCGWWKTSNGSTDIANVTPLADIELSGDASKLVKENFRQ